MLKKISICHFCDILDHGVKMGFFYNQAHDLMVEADLYVGYLCKDHYSDNAYCEPHEHVEARNILKSFMALHQVDEIYVTPKNHDCP